MVDTEASLCQVPILGGFRGASSRIPWRGDLDRRSVVVGSGKWLIRRAGCSGCRAGHAGFRVVP